MKQVFIIQTADIHSNIRDYAYIAAYIPMSAYIYKADNYLDFFAMGSSNPEAKRMFLDGMQSQGKGGAHETESSTKSGACYAVSGGMHRASGQFR